MIYQTCNRLKQLLSVPSRNPSAEKFQSQKSTFCDQQLHITGRLISYEVKKVMVNVFQI